MHFACWITKATDTHTQTHTHSEYVILTALHDNDSYANESQRKVCMYLSHFVGFALFSEAHIVSTLCRIFSCLVLSSIVGSS